MEVEIIKPDGDLKREVWKFVFRDDYSAFRIVIGRYAFQVRETRRHKWRVQTRWERWDKRMNIIDHPPLPAEVITEAKKKLVEMIEALPVTE
jgi:hypothetical protein